MRHRWQFLIVTAAALFAAGGPARAQVQVVNSFAGAPSPGVWYTSDVRPGGTASIVDLTGAGGDLETNQPLPTGAARLSTDATTAAKAEVAVSDNYGTVSSILNTLSLGYSYYKQGGTGGDASAAPAFKLTFSDGSGGSGPSRGFITLVYEPYWNQPGNVGSASTTPADVWTGVTIDKDNGVFWGNDGFGNPNSFGGAPLRTLAQWSAALNANFQNATLVAVSVGMGTFNPSQIGYFDRVILNGTALPNVTYDFQAAPIPEPSPLALGGVIAAAGSAVAAARRRRGRARARNGVA